MTTQRGNNTKAWRLLRCLFAQEDAISLLAQRTGIDPSLMLTDNKLPPDVSAAIPLSIADHMDTSGQTIYFPTFTYEHWISRTHSRIVRSDAITSEFEEQ